MAHGTRENSAKTKQPTNHLLEHRFFSFLSFELIITAIIVSCAVHFIALTQTYAVFLSSFEEIDFLKIQELHCSRKVGFFGDGRAVDELIMRRE
jgi:multisubunit Na+/H+ antiporter MnhC subunit